MSTSSTPPSASSGGAGADLANTTSSMQPNREDGEFPDGKTLVDNNGYMIIDGSIMVESLLTVVNFVATGGE